MIELDVDADTLVATLLRLSKDEPVCILDSCGVKHLGSHLLIAGVRPIEVIELVSDDLDRTAAVLDQKLDGPRAAIFTLSYDLGARLQNVHAHDRSQEDSEPDVFLALFDALVIHDYDSGQTAVTGDASRANEISRLIDNQSNRRRDVDKPAGRATATATSSFNKASYIAAVNTIKDRIRAGDTYQTNLTQKIRCELPAGQTAQKIFENLRRDHPAPFGAFIRRTNSTVVSASPERFFRITPDGFIEASPIKGTRRRGTSRDEDARLRAELLSSEKDRAENTMIVDLVRNDLGRVCEYGSVEVEKLCDLEEHPTLFHLVSTVRGKLCEDWSPSQILRATFPCGSITGAPKLRTMEIIDEIEPVPRGLSMGAIGFYASDELSTIAKSTLDLSVAIRTMVVRDRSVELNVGGGIVIDSDPESEYAESLLKASALLTAIGAKIGGH